MCCVSLPIVVAATQALVGIPPRWTEAPSVGLTAWIRGHAGQLAGIKTGVFTDARVVRCSLDWN